MSAQHAIADLQLRLANTADEVERMKIVKDIRSIRTLVTKKTQYMVLRELDENE